MRQKTSKQIRKIAKLLVYTSPNLDNTEATVKRAHRKMKKLHNKGELINFLKQLKNKEEDNHNGPDISAPRPL